MSVASHLDMGSIINNCLRNPIVQESSDVFSMSGSVKTVNCIS